MLSDVGFEVGDLEGVTPGTGGGQVESHMESADQDETLESISDTNGGRATHLSYKHCNK